ncbi:hypothetical protein EMMF5_001629 [Cystobasidiomycetes sp. EMM_F5]
MTAAADALLDPAKALHPENVAHNARALNYIRSTIASIAGAVAGILGVRVARRYSERQTYRLGLQLTSLSGFGFYLLTSIMAACVIYVCNAELKPAKYFYNGFLETATQGLLGNLLSYTLCEQARMHFMQQQQFLHR